ncbi:unnamed protein product, partial [Rotaria magnacalcarata]
MEKSDDDDNTAEDLCTQDITTGVGMKETGSTNKTLDKRKDNKYYCNLCASGGWDKSVSLSQHIRHMHKSEYNASIEVPLTKRRWTKDEILILAEFEAKIPSSD